MGAGLTLGDDDMAGPLFSVYEWSTTGPELTGWWNDPNYVKYHTDSESQLIANGGKVILYVKVYDQGKGVNLSTVQYREAWTAGSGAPTWGSWIGYDSHFVYLSNISTTYVKWFRVEVDAFSHYPNYYQLQVKATDLDNDRPGDSMTN